MAGKDDMMVSYRVGQEIRGSLPGQSQHHLRAAEVRLGLTSKQFTFAYEMHGNVSVDLENGDRSGRNIPTYPYSYPRFEMGVQTVTGDHVERNGTMGEDDLPSLGIDAGRIGLEAAETRDCAPDHHGYHRRDISFASCHNTL